MTNQSWYFTYLLTNFQKSNANVDSKQEYDIVDSVMILIDDQDTDHLLFEIGDLELTHISLDNGVLEIRAVQRIYQDIRTSRKRYQVAIDSVLNNILVNKLV